MSAERPIIPANLRPPRPDRTLLRCVLRGIADNQRGDAYVLAGELYAVRDELAAAQERIVVLLSERVAELEAAAPASEPVEEPEGEWACPKCSCVNQPVAKICVKCAHRKPEPVPVSEARWWEAKFMPVRGNWCAVLTDGNKFFGRDFDLPEDTRECAEQAARENNERVGLSAPEGLNTNEKGR